MTLFFSTDQITIYRNKAKGNNKWDFSATSTVINADITPAALQRLQFVDGQVGKNYTGYIEVTADVKEGDRVITADGKRFLVKSVSIWEGFGVVDCKELDLVSKD